jgi:hypothetical protein
MKKQLQAALFILALIVTASCDKIPRPIVEKLTVEGSNFRKNTNRDISHFRKTLLEDYTGHRCLNCPTAASIIKNDLMPVYGHSLIVIAAHQGDLARPFGASFPNDYRTDAGETWGSSTGFGTFNEWPTGLLNRKDYQSNGLKLSYSKWTSAVPMAIHDPFVLRLDVDTEYDPEVRALNVFVKGTFQTAYQNKVNLVAVYVQDSVVGKQVDGPKYVEDYVFEHMLRGDINGIWGVEFSNGSRLASDSVKWSVRGFPIPLYTTKGEISKTIYDKKVSVVVFAYDAVSREVIQVEQVKIY